MFGTDRMSPAALAAGLVVLATVAGCKGEPSVASKSAAAFREAQQKGETFEGSGHSHGGHEAADTPPPGPGAETGHDEHATQEAGHASAEGSAADHSAMGHGADHQTAGQTPRRSGSTAQGTAEGHHGNHAAHGGMDHGQSPASTRGDAGHAGHGSAPSAPAAQDHGAHATQGSATQPRSSGAGHAGHAAAPEVVPETPAPAQVPSPGQPASTLRPGALDAPATTSVTDAQRSADMAAEMAGGGGHGGHGGHGAHGVSRYRHVDVGRGPEAYDEADVPPPPAAGTHQHHQAEEPGTATATAGYTCPMHPEVVSETPGTCPKCGMALVPKKGDQ